jgi:hypothetical protein
MAANSIIYMRMFHDPFFNHRFCTARAFFCWLKEKFEITRELFFEFINCGRSAQYHCDMSIMSAGVHPTFMFRSKG